MKTATPTKGHPLPSGHDDPLSAFYVPEELRDSWAQHAGAADIRGRHGVARVIAGHRAYLEHREQVAAADPRSPRLERQPSLLDAAVQWARSNATSLFSTTQDGAAATEHILNTHEDELRAEAEHALRLHHVRSFFDAEQREDERQRMIAKHNRCPVCGIVGSTRPGMRELVPGTADRYGERVTINSCSSCYLVALASLAETFGDAITESGLSRREVVAAHLPELGVMPRG